MGRSSGSPGGAAGNPRSGRVGRVERHTPISGGMRIELTGFETCPAALKAAALSDGRAFPG
ncbi:MAG: hypothetical protein HOP29_07855 [Phycisphaerales bacterium]|nr:hypothetical protein [Phycisphaerales bacterium]